MLDGRAKRTVGQFRLIDDWSDANGKLALHVLAMRESFQGRRTFVVHGKRRFNDPC